MNRKSQVVKTAISLTPIVLNWAKTLAEEKGFGSNFSAYVADLIRRDRENAEKSLAASKLSHDGREGRVRNDPWFAVRSERANPKGPAGIILERIVY